MARRKYGTGSVFQNRRGRWIAQNRIGGRYFSSSFATREEAEEAAACNAVSYEDRFWAQVDRSGDCWEWQGTWTGSGRGIVRYEGKYRNASRVAYILTFGPIPNGLLVCHHCDNPLCVRLEHLFLGTQSDNMQDMVAKGRNLGTQKIKRDRDEDLTQRILQAHRKRLENGESI